MKVEHAEETTAIWKTYLSQTLLSTRISTKQGTLNYGIARYHPSLLSRQFGFFQLRPTCFCRSKSELKKPTTEEEYLARFRNFYFIDLGFEPFKFNLKYACTKEFDNWWIDYYMSNSASIDEATILSQLISPFPAPLQKQKEKAKGTHISEIQAFKKYFEVVYDPRYLSRTVSEAARHLKEKVLSSLSKMDIPSFVQDKYSFALSHFKVPPLPTSELALAFRPPTPHWFVCGSFNALVQDTITKAALKITSTKYHIYNYRDILPLDIQDVQILSPIGTDEDSSKRKIHLFLFLHWQRIYL